MLLIGQTQIEILSSDELSYDSEIGKYQRCIGNVKFKQDNVYMDCDSAYFYEDENKIEAFSNIYVRQKDTLNLWGDYILYNGNTRMAVVKKNVRLTDGKMELKTEQLDYDLNSKVAYYTTGGKIKNGNDRLSSRVGRYYSRSKTFFFKDSVKLNNPEYTMDSDTLRYISDTKVAYFYGPTYIKSDENTIYCEYGWYNTDNNKSQFSKGSYIEGKNNKLWADSMEYDRNTGFGEAFGNIKMTDTIENILITGAYGSYKRLENITLITGNPMAISYSDDDTLYLKADTFIDQIDTANKRALTAFKRVRVYRSDMQSLADSLEYNFTDSTIVFFGNPILWTDKSQITGDTIWVFRSHKGIDSLHARSNGFIIEEDLNGLYNQISGRSIVAFFKEKKLKKVNVDGNGASIYYALEEEKQYSGVNSIVCSSMVIRMDEENKVDRITFITQPKATFYPLEAFPIGKSKLEGFMWHTDKRPIKAHFIGSNRSEVQSDVKKTTAPLRMK